MIVKNCAVLEVKKGDQVYSFHCSPYAPLGELYDVLCEFKSYVVSRMNEQEAKKDPAPTENLEQ